MSDENCDAVILWQESARSHIMLGQYSAAEGFVRKILETLETKYEGAFHGCDEVLRMFATLYCHVKEWDMAERILTELVKQKKARQRPFFDSASSEAIVHAAIRQLLEMGATVRAKDNSTALHQAAIHGQEKVVRLLLEISVDVTDE
jgi:hypothetical protein